MRMTTKKNSRRTFPLIPAPLSRRTGKADY
jgi:hypothetical protein